MRRAAVIGAALTVSDDALLRYLGNLADNLLASAARGEEKATIDLPVKAWLAIIDEIRDRRPRNYSRLLADDTIARLNEIIDNAGRTVGLLNINVAALEEVAAKLEKKR